MGILTSLNTVLLFSVIIMVHTRGKVVASGGSSIYSASQRGDLAEVTKLANGTCKDVNWKNGDGKYTPLQTAAEYNRKEVVKFLLDCKANQDMKSTAGTTALMFASKAGHFDVAKILLDNGADPLITRNEGQTALSWAQENGFPDIVKLINLSNVYLAKQADGIVEQVKDIHQQVNDIAEQVNDSSKKPCLLKPTLYSS
ncbi:unnamed protein product [Meganyctiphanes norvegica]|uniref:Uncharacterized protein n=1 Tax=Meganyctiphanes norvegica TaxID=48144 RepID=A0AAV2Q8N5_MEGNR